MIKELLIFLTVAVLVVVLQFINSIFSTKFSSKNIYDVPLFDFEPINGFLLVFIFYIILFIIRLIFGKIFAWLFEIRDEKDIEFVHTLYAQSNAKIKTYAYLLFFMIILLFSSAFIWSYFQK